jgi:Zn-dependent protease
VVDFSPDMVRWIIQALIILILSICVHEFGHAFVADKLGDDLPRRQGRVTLNPVPHADPLGTLLFPFMFLAMTGWLGFGWGRPVQVQPVNFTRKLRMRTAHMLVAMAGPLMNVAFAVVISGIHLALITTGTIEPISDGGIPSTFHEILQFAFFLNIILFFFNLIPAPPLDGGAVLEGLLPTRYLPQYQKYAVYGPFVLFAVIFIPGAHKIFTVPAFKVQTVWYELLGIPTMGY